jgi:hypothetical protein
VGGRAPPALLQQAGSRVEALDAVNEFIRLRPQDTVGYSLRKDIESM